MENRINIAEILKNCPRGMELNCVMYEDCRFLDVDSNNDSYLIRITTPYGIKYLDKYGCYTTGNKAKCIIFPKGKTTWEGFEPFYQFKNGDVVATSSGAWIGITTGGDSRDLIPTYCVIKGDGTFEAYLDVKKTWCFSRLATKEEKEKLFKAIKENGYEWNKKTKIIKKLVEPKFHVGDWVVNKFGDVWHIDSLNCEYYQVSNGNNYCYFLIEEQDEMRLWTIDDAKDGDVLSFYCEYKGNKMAQVGIIKKYVGKHGGCSNTFKVYVGVDWDNNLQMGKYMGCPNIYPATKAQCDLLFQEIKEAGYKWVAETKTLEKLIVLKFKVGDRIKGKYTNNIYTISSITPTEYNLTNGQSFTFDDEDCYELVPNKFDVSTLEPYDKVLVRLARDGVWHATFFSHYDKEVKWGCYPFVTTSSKSYSMCIPYKGNEHLRGTKDDCDEFYKTWE